MGTCHILPQHATRSPLSSFARVVLADLISKSPGYVDILCFFAGELAFPRYWYLNLNIN